jgi:hypothetical protein
VDSSDSAYKQVAVSCEECHELSGSIKGRESLYKLTDRSLLKKGKFCRAKFIIANAVDFLCACRQIQEKTP